MTFSRRKLLQGLGVGAGTLFLPSLAGVANVRADDPGPAKRLVLIGTGHGTVHKNHDMRPSGLAGPETASWEFPLTAPGLGWSRILAPLMPLARKVTVVDGLASFAALAGGPGNEHDRGCIGAFTATGSVDVGGGVLVAKGASIDQIVSAQIARADRLPSIEAGGYYRGMIYDAGGKALPSEGSPAALWSRLFGSPAPGTSDDALVTARQGSVLDLVRGRYAELGKRLSAEDAKKLAAHADLVRDLESRLAGLAALKCTPQAAPVDADTNAPTGAYKKNFDAFASLVAAAFACDLTRVASIQMNGPSNGDMGAPPGDVHQLYAHHADDGTPHSDATDDGTEYMTRYHTFDATLVASLASLLDGIPEGGGTMLDNTLIVWAGELGTGGHWLGKWPAVLVGNVGGKLKTGRYVHLAQDVVLTGSSAHTDKNFIGAPHNQLLTTIANAFGVSTNLVGDATAMLEGRPVPLSGALTRLLA